jgi:hypothetical protein
VDYENRRECPNGWGVFHPLAESHAFEENEKIVHVLFLALPARRISVQHIADDRDDNRYGAHPENGPDYQ